MDKKYLLSLALVGSLGLNAAQLTMIGTSHASEPQAKPAQCRVVYTTAKFTSRTGAQMASDCCANIDATEGLTGADKCALSDITGLSLFRNDSENPTGVTLTGQANLAGDWTRATP